MINLPAPNKITLHWTAGRYISNLIDQADYHGLICQKQNTGTKFTYIKLANYHETRQHCWHENTGNIGIAICGMYNAVEYNFGNYPIMPEQLEILYQVVSEICQLKNIPVEKVFTHAERAVIMGYGVESGDAQVRWDLAILKPLSAGERLSNILVTKTANTLRKKIAEKKGFLWHSR